MVGELPQSAYADSPLGDGALDSAVRFFTLLESELFHKASPKKSKLHLFAKGPISEGAGNAVRR